MATRGGAEARWISTVREQPVPLAGITRSACPRKSDCRAADGIRFRARSNLPDRRRILDAALGPQPVDAAADAELRPRPHVAVEHLAVIADLLDDAHRPILGQAELLAEIAFDAKEPPDLRLIRF